MCTCVLFPHLQLKWMAQWTDLHNLLHGTGYCLDPEFHAYDNTTCPEELTDLYTMCDKFHGDGSAESAKAQLDWQCFYKAKKCAMFLIDNTWTNSAKMGQEEWYKMFVRPFHRELALTGTQVLAGNFCLLL